MSFLKRHGLVANGRLPEPKSEAELELLEGAGKLAERDGAAVLFTKAEDVVPTYWQGFKVTLKLTAYPPDAPRSHRRAVSAILDPVEDHARAICEAMSAARVIASVPITPEAAKVIEASGLSGPWAEDAAKLAVAEAAKIVRPYLQPEVTR